MEFFAAGDQIPEARPRFAGQDAEIIAVGQEILAALDVYTKDGGNLLGVDHVKDARLTVSRKVVQKPGSQLEATAYADIEFTTETGKKFSIKVQRVE